MGRRKHTNPVTPFAKLREDYNETHDKYLSQSDIAELAHVSKTTISRVENGTQAPNEAVIETYSKLFKVSTDYLTPIKKPLQTIPSDATPVREIGITEEVISTCKYIDTLSNRDENIRAVLNSLIGNGADTVCLLQSILSYLVNQQTGKSNHINEHFLIETVLDYINDIMKPQLETVIRRNLDLKRNISTDNFFSDKEV